MTIPESTPEEAPIPLIRLSRLPQFEDDIPDHPGWAYWQDADKRYWATRYGPKAYGIASLSETQLALAFGPVIRVIRPFATLVEIKPDGGWQFADPIEDHEVATELEAYFIAETMREELESLLMIHAL